MGPRRVRRPALFAAALLAALPAEGAQGWQFRPAAGGGQAGFAVDGAWRGLWLSCAGGGRARLTIATGGTQLQPGVDQTAVVTVDDTAFLQTGRAGEAEGEPVLSRTLAPADLAALAGALAKGKKAAVSTPAGRFALPLGGSSKALQSLLAACGG